MRCFIVIGGILSLLPATLASAQTRLTDEQAATAFGSRERILDASLAPDGTKVALIAPGPKQSTVVQVLDLKTGSAKPINYANGDPMTLRSCGWASNTRLVCTLYGVSNREGGYDGYSRLIAMDADGNNPMPLGIMQIAQDYISRSDGYVIDWRDGESDKVLIARNYVPLKNNAITVGSKAIGLGVDLLDTRTGKTDHVESPDRIVGQYIADGRGRLRQEEPQPARQRSPGTHQRVARHDARDDLQGGGRQHHSGLTLPSELIVYPDIDHQLGDSAVRVDMLTRSDAFLKKALAD